MNDLYDCGRRLEAARKRLSTLPYAELLLAKKKLKTLFAILKRKR
jgi:hypothetical protein